MKFVKQNLSNWIQAAIILTVGILCIVAGATLGNNDISTATDSLEAISMVLGIALIVVGGLSLILAVLAGILAKQSFAAVGFPGAILLAVGISMVVAKYAYDFIAILLTVVPYLLLCIGAVVLGDAIFTFILAIKAKQTKKALVGFIVGCVAAAIAITLGALCVGNDPVIKYGVQLIVFGIVVILVAVLKVVLTFVKVPDAVIVAVKAEEKSE